MTKHELRRPKDDKDPYWDVLGDGWNPGHTMTEDEIKYESRALVCFMPGLVDNKKGIYWKYFGPGPEDRPKNLYSRREVGKRLLELATKGVDDCHDYEVEKNV